MSYYGRWNTHFNLLTYKLKEIVIKIISYNLMPNILVDCVLPNKPLSNFEIIDAAKKLSLYGFRGVFL